VYYTAGQRSSTFQYEKRFCSAEFMHKSIIPCDIDGRLCQLYYQVEI